MNCKKCGGYVSIVDYICTVCAEDHNVKNVKDEITVLIIDSKGKTFSRDWKNTSDKRNAIRWTLEHGDLPHYIDIAEIIQITVN